MADGPMKIAHISDLHLRHHLPGTSAVAQRLSRQMPAQLAAAVELINDEKPDLVVLSGDLLDYPLDGLDDPQVQAQGRRDLQLVHDTLRPLAAPLAAVHGNHDHRQLFRSIFAAADELAVAGYRVLAFFDDEGADHIPERIGNQRRRFEAALGDEDERPQIHVQHYLTAPERNEGYPHTYGDGAQMHRAAAASGRVRLVLSGHYHPGVDLAARDGVYYSTAPAFAQAPHPLRFYQLGPQGFEQREVAVGAI